MPSPFSTSHIPLIDYRLRTHSTLPHTNRFAVLHFLKRLDPYFYIV